MDDFGVKYENKADVQDLINILNNNYKVVTIDWAGALYAGINLDCDCKNKKVHLTMPGYIKRAFHQFQHHIPDAATMSPYP